MSSDASTSRLHGGYRQLRSFQVTEIIYDGTVAFCERFVGKRSRTHDQMVQAARSGRQNITEGSRASATSSQSKLRLVNVARASLDERRGYSERLAAARLEEWQKQKETRSDRSEKKLTCAACGKAIVLRTVRKGLRAGSQFRGCSCYPECRETMPLWEQAALRSCGLTFTT